MLYQLVSSVKTCMSKRVHGGSHEVPCAIFITFPLTPDNIAMKHLLYTERLLLRPARKQDAKQVFEGYAANLDACRYLTFSPHQQIEDTIEFLARCEAEWRDGVQYTFALCEQQHNQRLLGLVSYRKPGPHRVSFGYALNPDKWGKGYMPEAIHRLMDMAWKDPTVHRIEATCDVQNKASARVMEKCGLVWEGILKRHTLLPNISPIPRDMHSYARIRN